MVAGLKTPYMIAAGVIAAALIYVTASGAKRTGQQIGTMAVDMVDGALSGAVIGIGERVGIPATNQTECERAIAEGRTWDASFACPAGTFLKSLFN